MGGLGVSGGMAWTMRTDSLEVWRDLVLHGMGEVDFHVWPTWTYEHNQLISRNMFFFVFRNLDTSQNLHFFTKWLFLFFFVCLFLGLSWPGSLGRTMHEVRLHTTCERCLRWLAWLAGAANPSGISKYESITRAPMTICKCLVMWSIWNFVCVNFGICGQSGTIYVCNIDIKENWRYVVNMGWCLVLNRLKAM